MSNTSMTTWTICVEMQLKYCRLVVFSNNGRILPLRIHRESFLLNNGQDTFSIFADKGHNKGIILNIRLDFPNIFLKRLYNLKQL